MGNKTPVEIEDLETFGDLKRKKIKGNTLSEHPLYHFFIPLTLEDSVPLKEVFNDGDIITALIEDEDPNEVLSVTSRSEDLVHLIVGTRAKFDILPLQPEESRRLPTSFFKQSLDIGVVMRETGEDGSRVFRCNMHTVRDGKEVVIRHKKIFQYSGNLEEEVQVKKEKVFKEAELKTGFLSPGARDGLNVTGGVVGF